jgi:hypothetical protein
MQELLVLVLVDFITSLDGYGAAEGWPGFWGLQGPEYLAWLGEQPERDYTILMGANTYRLMSGFAAEAETLEADEAAAMDELARTPKVVFSSTLQPEGAGNSDRRWSAKLSCVSVSRSACRVSGRRAGFAEGRHLRCLLGAAAPARAARPASPLGACEGDRDSCAANA